MKAKTIHPESGPDTIEMYRSLIGRHFDLIERQCRNVVRRQFQGFADHPVNTENEALELCNLVLDTLKRDNYHVMRQFKGDAKLTTYITTIISRQWVELMRKKWGRSREKERAKKFGDIGLLIREKMSRGHTVPEIYRQLKEAGEPTHSLREIEAMVETIKGRKPEPAVNSPGSAVRQGTLVQTGDGDEARLIVPDTADDPQQRLMEQERDRHLRNAVNTVLAQLDGQERLILKMRFPTENEEKRGKIEDIAALLGISEKSVYKRITTLLKKCRRLLQQEGINSDDLQ